MTRPIECPKCGSTRTGLLPRETPHTFTVESFRIVDRCCLDCWHRWEDWQDTEDEEEDQR